MCKIFLVKAIRNSLLVKDWLCTKRRKVIYANTVVIKSFIRTNVYFGSFSYIKLGLITISEAML